MDPTKADANRRKHGVAFEDATLVFEDPFAVLEPDRSGVRGQRRWRTTGRAGSTLLFVAHLTDELEDGDELVRIISARRATPREKRRYEQERDGPV